MSAPLPKRHQIIVHLIRHASSESVPGTSDPKLSAVGLDQCMRIDVDKRSITEIKHIISSPIRRALDTAVQLFEKAVLDKRASRIVIWPELQSYRGGGFREDTQTIGCLRTYGEAMLDISHVVSRNGQWSGLTENVKVVKNYLLEQRNSVVDEPYEIAVVSHSSILGTYVRDAWRNLTWITCVFNDQGSLEELPMDEFNKLKTSLQRRKIEKDKSIREQGKKEEERERQILLDQQDRDLVELLHRIIEDMGNVSNNLKEYAYSDFVLDQEARSHRERLRERGLELFKIWTDAKEDRQKEKQRRQSEEEKSRKRHIDMTRRRLQQHDRQFGNPWPIHLSDRSVAYRRRMITRALVAIKQRDDSYQIPPEEKMLRAYMSGHTEKIQNALSTSDGLHLYRQKSFEFLAFRFCLLPCPHLHRLRLELQQITSTWLQGESPPEPPAVALYDSQNIVSLGIYDSINEQYTLDLKPLLDQSVFSSVPSSYVSQISEEIRMLKGELTFDESLAVKSHAEYPMLPIMVNIRFHDGRGLYRGYFPGPPNAECESLLCKEPKGSEPAPEFPRPIGTRKRPISKITSQL